jgi:hypothetical protein
LRSKPQGFFWPWLLAIPLEYLRLCPGPPGLGHRALGTQLVAVQPIEFQPVSHLISKLRLTRRSMESRGKQRLHPASFCKWSTSNQAQTDLEGPGKCSLSPVLMFHAFLLVFLYFWTLTGKSPFFFSAFCWCFIPFLTILLDLDNQLADFFYFTFLNLHR